MVPIRRPGIVFALRFRAELEFFEMSGLQQQPFQNEGRVVVQRSLEPDILNCRVPWIHLFFDFRTSECGIVQKMYRCEIRTKLRGAEGCKTLEVVGARVETENTVLE